MVDVKMPSDAEERLGLNLPGLCLGNARAKITSYN